MRARSPGHSAFTLPSLTHTLMCLVWVGALPTVALADTEASRPPGSELPVGKDRKPLDFKFDKGSKGREAYEKIKRANKGKEFAERYQIKEQDIEQFLNRIEKEGGRLDRDGNLYFEEALPPTQINSAPPLLPTLPGITDDQTFKLHSRPNSKRKIYLDFKGETVTNSTWNAVTGISTLNHPAFDLDGIPGSFNTSELKTIQGIWHRVSDTFSAFDVDVTTEDPGYEALTRSSSTDDTYGMRVVITKRFNNANGQHCGCVGIAYVGGMDSIRTPGSMSYQPAYVFSDILKGVPDLSGSIAHELGHTLGLLHDGTANSTYYYGHGTGDTSWTTIMGSSHTATLKHWSKGEYPGANNKQDDYLVMQSNGLSFALDDHGNTIETSSLLQAQAINSGEFVANGVIQGPNDIDFFKVNLAAGYLEVSSLPGVGYTIDALVKIYNKDKQVIRQISPGAKTSVFGGVTIPLPGSYYVSIEGTGRAAILGDPGYPKYSSIGNYGLKLRAQSLTGNAPPTVTLTSNVSSGVTPAPFTFTAQGLDPEGFTIQYAWDFGDGTQAKGRRVNHIYDTAGDYKVSVTATDVMGLQDSENLTVKVVSPQTLPVMTLDYVSLYKDNLPDYKSVTAVVKVVDSKGAALKDVKVNAEWGGIVTGSCSRTTDANGTAFCSSPSSLQSGTWTFKITGVSKTGYQFVAPSNLINQSLTY